jgi:hypothetical protein
MHLYGLLSNIVHSKKEGVANHIYEENAIGDAFLYMLPHTKTNEGMTEETLSLICYTLGAIDPIAAKVLNVLDFPAFPGGITIGEGSAKSDFLSFQMFLSKMTLKYGEIGV